MAAFKDLKKLKTLEMGRIVAAANGYTAERTKREIWEAIRHEPTLEVEVQQLLERARELIKESEALTRRAQELAQKAAELAQQAAELAKRALQER